MVVFVKINFELNLKKNAPNLSQRSFPSRQRKLPCNDGIIYTP